MSEITTVICPRRPLHLAANDGGRFARAVSIEPNPNDDNEGTVLCAVTDGRMLAVSKEYGRTDQAVLAPADAFKAKANETVEIQKNGQWRKIARPTRGLPTSTELPDVEGRFPKWRTVLPNIKHAKTIQLSINPEQLATLAKTLGASGKAGLDSSVITLFLPIEGITDHGAVTGPIAVLYEHPELGASVGALMPFEPATPKPTALMTTEKRNYCEFIDSIPAPTETPKTTEPTATI